VGVEHTRRSRRELHDGLKTLKYLIGNPNTLVRFKTDGITGFWNAGFSVEIVPGFGVNEVKVLNIQVGTFRCHVCYGEYTLLSIIALPPYPE